MRTRRVVGTLAVVVALVGTAIAAEKEFADYKAKCPISGGPAKEGSTADYLGRKVHFCCDNCPKKFAADSKPFAAKANHQLLLTEQLTQVGCPFSGGKAKPETAIDVAGVKVAFCCENCQGKAEKAEDAVALIFGNIEKGFTVQTECPLSGKPISAAVSVEHDGKKVYFCCEGCPAGFEADPAKFVAKLPQFAEEDK